MLARVEVLVSEHMRQNITAPARPTTAGSSHLRRVSSVSEDRMLACSLLHCASTLSILSIRTLPS
jgi:hypothetical protein